MLALGALVFVLAAAGPGAPSMPACIHVTTDSRYVPYGYNHVVILRNGCSKPATCSVATDVAPQPQTVEVAAGSTVEVTTFMGSPQQGFTAKVSCKTR
jgi:hypothetical protein